VYRSSRAARKLAVADAHRFHMGGSILLRASALGRRSQRNDGIERVNP
jgi:hypothetical protein